MTFKPEVLDWSKGHAQAKNDIQMIIDEMKKQLKAGMPAQTIVLGLTDSGVEKEDAARLLVEATNNRFSKCNQCNLDFISSLTYCPQCGNKMILHSY